MACRLSRYGLAASAVLVGGVFMPCIASAASPGGGRSKLDLSAVYAQRLGLTAQVAAQITAAPLPAAPHTVMVALAGVPRVGTTELGRMRAGFALPNGIWASFGFTSTTFLNGNSTPIQTLNIGFSGSGNSYSGSVSTTSNGVEQTNSLTSGGLATKVFTAANNGLTSVQTMIGDSGLTTVIKNEANGQLIQHFQTLNLATSGLQPILEQQTTQEILSTALNAGKVFHGR